MKNNIKFIKRKDDKKNNILRETMGINKNNVPRETPGINKTMFYVKKWV